MPIPENDMQTVDEQAKQIFKLTDVLGKTAGESMVTIYNQRGRISYGISIGEEKVIAKWSDLIGQGEVSVSQGDGKSLSINPLGYYPEQDLVVLKVNGLTAPAMIWGLGEELEEGRMLISINPKGQSTSLGVVSVGVRSMRAAEEGFLGVEMNALWKGAGINIRAVTLGGAAEQAGLKAGDTITHVGDDQVDGLLEMQTRIRRFKAGDMVDLRVRRGDDDLKISPTLMGYDVGKAREPMRLRTMDRMSGGVSKVRDDFPSVLQSDLELDPEDSGAPVIDLDGKVIGMVIARADRVSTLILPAKEIQRVLKTKPKMAERPQIAQQKVVPQEGSDNDDAQQNQDDKLKRMSRDMRDMRRMMEEMHQDER